MNRDQWIAVAGVLVAVIGTGVTVAGLMLSEIGTLRSEIGTLRHEAQEDRDRIREQIATLRKEIGDIDNRTNTLAIEIAAVKGELKGKQILSFVPGTFGTFTADMTPPKPTPTVPDAGDATATDRKSPG